MVNLDHQVGFVGLSSFSTVESLGIFSRELSVYKDCLYGLISVLSFFRPMSRTSLILQPDM